MVPLGILSWTALSWSWKCSSTLEISVDDTDTMSYWSHYASILLKFTNKSTQIYCRGHWKIQYLHDKPGVEEGSCWLKEPLVIWSLRRSSSIFFKTRRTHLPALLNISLPTLFGKSSLVSTWSYWWNLFHLSQEKMVCSASSVTQLQNTQWGGRAFPILCR